MASILNERPLSARSFSEEDFFAISPKDLLLGATPVTSLEEGLQQVGRELSEKRLEGMIKGVEEKVQSWWVKFYYDVFPLLVPRRSMMREFQPLQLGDVVLVRYAAKYSADRYRLARVLDLHPDKHGVVRTVSVGLRNARKAGAARQDLNRAGLVVMQTPVQRLVLILPASEQPPEILEKLREEATWRPAGQEVEQQVELEGLPQREPGRRSARIQARRLAEQVVDA